MNSDAVQVERRGAQRFDFHLPVSLRAADDREGQGFTQDLSGRGALVCTDLTVAVGEKVDLTLVMPTEITLSEQMRVRCRGTVVRVVPPSAGAKSSLAVQIEGYEFLPDAKEDTLSRPSERISGLHQQHNSQENADKSSVSPHAALR